LSENYRKIAICLIYIIQKKIISCPMKPEILLLNGPNLNLLGTREPDVYGSQTLESVIQSLIFDFNEFLIVPVTSNHEGVLIDAIHDSINRFGIVINAGGFSHTSVAIADAIKAVKTPAIEVHISNVAQREEFRHKTYLSPVCLGTITGFGIESYFLAFTYFRRKYTADNSN
jgi:3-dehydroquinate dehydratase-2